MNVHYTSAEVVGDRQELQEAGHAHQVGAGLADQVEDAAAELLAAGTFFSGYDCGGEAGRPRAGQSIGGGLIGNDLNDAGREPAIRDPVDQVLQRGPAAAEQDRDSDRVHPSFCTTAASLGEWTASATERVSDAVRVPVPTR